MLAGPSGKPSEFTDLRVETNEIESAHGCTLDCEWVGARTRGA